MRKPWIADLAGGTWLFLIALVQAAPNTNNSSDKLTIPYVPTRQDVVSDSLWLANVGKDDVVYDLGSGDGRIVIAAVRDRGARKAVGIEIDPKRVAESREKAREAGVSERTEFIQGDLFTNDFSQASVVFLYLGHAAHLDLRSKLVRTLKPGARIVSHQFGMGEWPPDKQLEVRTPYLGMTGMMFNPFAWNPNVPDFGANRQYFLRATVSMWVVPAPVAGVWSGKVHTPEGERDLKLILYQSLAGVTGSFQLKGSTNFEGGLVTDDLWGNHLRFMGMAAGKHYFEFRMMFDGHVSENTLKGTLAVSEGERLHESSWEAQRDKADFTGAWEWPCPSGPRQVQLQIERRNGRLAATYVDGQRKVAVNDFYDFGGGFYFTILIGREGVNYHSYSLRVDENCGWLIGQGLASEGGLTGKIAFYPYRGTEAYGEEHRQGQDSSAWRDWSPNKVQKR